MTQAIAQHTQFTQSPVYRISLVQQPLPVYARLPVGREHLHNLVQRETGGAAQGDQRQPLQHIAAEQAAQAVPAYARDQAFFLVVAQGRGWQASAARDLGDIQFVHTLDLKPT